MIILNILLVVMLLAVPLAQSKELVKEQDMVAQASQIQDGEQQTIANMKPPLAARISDALTRRDREAAVEILEHENLTLNDKMNLLYLAGRKNEAADIAFVLMERAPMDASLYDQSAPLLLENSRTAEVRTTFNAYDSYSSLRTGVSSDGHRFESLKFDIGVHQESRSNVDTMRLTSAPAETGGDIAVHQGGDSYDNIWGVQFSQSLNTHAGASLKHRHRIGSRLNIEAVLAYNQSATENAALRIVGRSNQFGLQGSYALDASTQWMIGGALNQYQSIDGVTMGSGQLLTSTLSHALSGAYPALHTRITGTQNAFQTVDKTLTGLAASLIPAGQSNTAAYFMPQDVNEIAVYGSVGDQTDRRLPAGAFEYFAELGVFYNPAIGSGLRAGAGLAGRVISADKLQIFIRFDQSPNGQDFSNFEAGAAYLLHY